jgi:hypothetical protein
MKSAVDNRAQGQGPRGPARRHAPSQAGSPGPLKNRAKNWARSPSLRLRPAEATRADSISSVPAAVLLPKLDAFRCLFVPLGAA